MFSGGGSLCGLVTWFLRNVACNSLACMSRFEIGSLGLQRSWGCRGKFGHPNCMRLVGREARGSNSYVRSSTQGCCLPYLGGASGLCSQGLLCCWTRLWWVVWVTSASERDISTDSILQAETAFSKQGSGRRHDVSGRFRRCVVAVSYSPTTHRLQYHRRCRA